VSTYLRTSANIHQDLINAILTSDSKGFSGMLLRRKQVQCMDSNGGSGTAGMTEVMKERAREALVGRTGEINDEDDL
jgi:hypothetical protein